MAQTAFQNTTFTPGAAARDLYQGGAQQQPRREQLPQERPVASPHTRVRPENHLLTVVGCLAAACVLLLVLFSHQRLFEATQELSRMERQLSQLQEEQIKLRSQYDKAVDLAAVERTATTTLGMSRPVSGQTVYLSFTDGERVEVLKKENDSIFAQVSRFVCGAFSDLGAYLTQR